VRRADIADVVRRAGVAPGDVLLVHSSLSSFGHVDGGAEAVIEALRDVLGADGLLIMPTFTRCRVASGRAEPAVAFDPARTACRDRTGAVPDTFWRMDGVCRSAHPTHSLAAAGARAAEFVSGGETRTFDPAGPYGRYSRWNGRALFLGARMGSNTTIHCAEDWMGLPFLTEERALVAGPDGPREVPVTGHPLGCRSFYRGGGRPAEVMRSAGIVGSAELKGAEVLLADAREIVRICCEQEERRPGFLLCPETPHDFCSEGLEKTLEQRDGILKRIAGLRASGWAPAEDGT
jgi:aminoglycoside 3-N-acetyltransferase